MNLFSQEQLDNLAHLGIFRPSGTNDDLRVDMRDGQPFYAIDPARPSEIDDAIRVRRRQDGGYVIQAAIADAAQLSEAPDAVDYAIRKRSNTYSRDGRLRRKILPRPVVAELELSDGENRALVISREYSPTLEAHDEVEITPAFVSTVTTRYGTFVHDYMNAEAAGQFHNPLVGFNHSYRKHHELPLLSARTMVDEGHPLAVYGERLVETYMVLTNVAIAHWAAQTGVPILYRNFDREKTVWDELNEEKPVGGEYAPESEVHQGIGHIIPEAAVGYTHATSPLRRAVDLVNHLQIAAHIAGTPPMFDGSQLRSLSAHFNRHPRR